jgi:hypothetical protein
MPGQDIAVRLSAQHVLRKKTLQWMRLQKWDVCQIAPHGSPDKTGPPNAERELREEKITRTDVSAPVRFALSASAKPIICRVSYWFRRLTQWDRDETCETGDHRWVQTERRSSRRNLFLSGRSKLPRHHPQYRIFCFLSEFHGP